MNTHQQAEKSAVRAGNDFPPRTAEDWLTLISSEISRSSLGEGLKEALAKQDAPHR